MFKRPSWKKHSQDRHFEILIGRTFADALVTTIPENRHFIDLKLYRYMLYNNPKNVFDNKELILTCIKQKALAHPYSKWIPTRIKLYPANCTLKIKRKQNQK